MIRGYALSIMQPWAWLIVMGYKPIENRDWYTKFRGAVFIHAGKQFDKFFNPQGLPDIARSLPHRDALPRGGIVGKANIIDCVREHDSPWFFGEYGFVISEARPLPFIPYRGALGFFPVEYPT